MIEERTVVFENFIYETEELLQRVVPGIGTEMYENLHSRKSKFAWKDFAWQGSWAAQISAVILDMNVPNWRLKRFCQLPLLPLHPRTSEVIMAHEKKGADLRTK
jgi:hypothetical protein